MLYCENCGVSFLWTGEEQREGDPVQPRCCPGCRRLLPPAEHERGLVKWYSPRKRYGFITRLNKPDLFVHRSAVKGRERLYNGDFVEYQVVDDTKGPAARAVRILARADGD